MCLVKYDTSVRGQRDEPARFPTSVKNRQNIHYQQQYSSPIQSKYMSRNPVDADKNSTN